jgi:hypothetical protein
MNDIISKAKIRTTKPLMVDSYRKQNHRKYHLIDDTNETVGGRNDCLINIKILRMKKLLLIVSLD